MGMSIVEAKVIGVKASPTDSESQSTLLGADLSFSNGHITDVNSEGSPPATQFFIDKLTLTKGGVTLISGRASKAASQWLNSYRNVNLVADAGAGGYVYHVIRKSDPETYINIPGFDNPKVVGVILRYYLYRPLPKVNGNAAIEALYQQQLTNPVTLELVGTFAPLYEEERIWTIPTGRLMVCNQTQIPTPPGSRNNGNNGFIALAPAVLQQKDNLISVDFAAPSRITIRRARHSRMPSTILAKCRSSSLRGRTARSLAQSNTRTRPKVTRRDGSLISTSPRTRKRSNC
jgi:hypothetical protein